MVTDFPQQPKSIAQAKKVLANPSDYAHKPYLFMAAWSILKSARGQTVRQSVVINGHQKRRATNAIHHQYERDAR